MNQSEVAAKRTVLTRLICGIVLHVNTLPRLHNGMGMMKYALNHHWKMYYRVAFMSGFFQFTVAVFVETIGFIGFLTYEDEIEIIMDFTALIIISDFDKIFFLFNESKLKTLITDKEKAKKFLIIQTTTSRRAKH